MRKFCFIISAALLVMGSLLAFSAWAEMVIHLRNGQQVRLPYSQNDVDRIEYTHQQSGGFGQTTGSIPRGLPWVVNSNGNIYRRTTGGWQQMPGLAKDIGIGANGSVWVIGTDSTGGGYGIYRWNGSNWDRVDGGAVRIAVAPNGFPWVVNVNGNIYQRTAGGWRQMPGRAKDIGIGADGSVWVIGTDSRGGGHGIYRWNGTNWDHVDGGAVRIAVAPNGLPWVVNVNGNIYRRTTNGWQQMPGLAKDIGVGADGSVWVIGTNPTGGGYGIYYWNGTDWTRVDGGAVEISVR